MRDAASARLLEVDVVSWGEIALALGCVVLGAAVQATIGFGASLVSIPLLLLVNPALVPGPAAVAGLTVNLIGMRAGVADADWRGVRWAAVGLVPGTLVAAWALTTFSRPAIAVLSAAAVLVAVGVSALGLRPAGGRRVLLAAGVFSGYLNTTAGVGGPPMALAYQDAPAKVLRSTLPSVFVVATVLSMVILVRTGYLDAPDWRIGLLLAPGGAVGYAVAQGWVHRIDGSRLRGAVLVVSAVSALAALARVLL